MLAAQDNKCVICTADFTSPKDMHTDHCHTTGKVRGILCQGCNQGIGNFKENPEALRRAADYLS